MDRFFPEDGPVFPQIHPHSCRERPLPDLLIAAAAEAAGLPVLHYDTDFDLVAAVTGQESRWVVEAGSVP